MRTHPDPHAVIEVLLVDDDDGFFEDIYDGLIYQSQIPYRIHVVGRASNGQEALVLAERLQPDIVIMDLKMEPGIDGVETALLLNQRKIETKVLIFSSHLDFKDMKSIVNAGVWGYILKGDLEKLVDGIQRVFHDEPCFPYEVTQSLFRQQFTHKTNESTQIDAPSKTAKPRYKHLSEREKEVLALFNLGLSNLEISEALDITLSSVRTYHKRIEKKRQD